MVLLFVLSIIFGAVLSIILCAETIPLETLGVCWSESKIIYKLVNSKTPL